MPKGSKVKENASKSGVIAAYHKLQKTVPPTLLLPLKFGDATLWCKCESDQPMGAFKLRGAWHRLTDLSESERAQGVVAFSSGNHAQGVAWAAEKLGISATIVMPADAPQLKIAGTRKYGAEIILYDRMTEDRVAIATQLAADRGAVLVPSFDDPWVIEGQGSAGLEALDQLTALGMHAPDLVVVPCGGGGLAAGLALVLPEARIVVVEPEGWDDMGESLRGGEIVPVGPSPPHTSCDALQTPRVSALTFDILLENNVTGVSVSEEEVFAGMRLAHAALGKIVEPGGAVALAAIIAGKVKPGARTLVLLSGGNVDPAFLGNVLV